ncbi:MAG: tRNA-dihydrouridine synthase family protein [Muribaculaceae bacterium]|nr:tRNA-dihydrouridine synthase family protein [Muribaculaceae bacterium]
MNDIKNRIPVLAAPLQGVTDNVWRMAQHEVFGGVDAYYAPFMRVEHGEVRRKDLRDVDPERNAGTTLIPQILACQPEHALMMVDALKQMGYRRIDINLGCPFPPIALHRKGSGMLAYPDLAENLFKALAAMDGVEYSVKMRLGWDRNDQWRDILPLMEVLKPVNIAVHPRIGKQQYKGDLDIEQFEALLAASPWPVVYNGSLRTVDDIEEVINRYPSIAAVMVGSGLAANPGMLSPDATPDDYRRFHDMLVDGYTDQLNGGEAQLVRHLQDIWQTFLPGTGHKLFKAIRKSRTLEQYETAAAAALADVENALTAKPEENDEQQ